MNESRFNKALLNFLKSSPTPFHAVLNISKILGENGFVRLDEKDAWKLKKGVSYYVIRNDSSIIAFIYGKESTLKTGMRITGAHTDSPCLKLKPNPEMTSNSYFQLGVEIYGGMMLTTWFDRDLSLAGRVNYLSKKNIIKSALIDFKKPVAVIPNFALHMDRDANKNKSVNQQKDLPPILFQVDESKNESFNNILMNELKKTVPLKEIASILEYELSFYDVQPPSIVGLKDDFIASARLDNLLSCFVGLMGLVDSNKNTTSILVCNDHEEVGSRTTAGAQGTFLTSTLKRLLPKDEDFIRAIDLSILISADNAHGIHPNYTDKFDPNHIPLLNNGPVIKINANQSYASNSQTGAIFKYLCLKNKVPVQSFVVRSDMGSGTTIGPITAAKTGIKTIDIGLPTFAMHSIRETCGVKDGFYLYTVLKDFNNLKKIPIEK